MAKFASVIVALGAAVLVTLGFAPAAHARTDVQINLGTSRHVLYGGDSFKATATANVSCDWALNWNGVGRQNVGAAFATTYVAPQVTRITKVPLTGACTYAAPSGAGSAGASAPLSTWHRTIMVTILPRAYGAASPAGARTDLSGPGGPDQAVFFGGLALLLTGAGAVAVARRRAEGADLPGQTA